MQPRRNPDGNFRGPSGGSRHASYQIPLASAVVFLFNIIETKFLRASSSSEFSHSLGQNRKSSMRAYVFRFAPESRRRAQKCHDRKSARSLTLLRHGVYAPLD